MNLIINELKKDPNYEDFFNDYEWKYQIHITIKGVPWVVFNTLDGSIDGKIKWNIDSENHILRKDISEGLCGVCNFLMKKRKTRNLDDAEVI